MIEPPTPSEPTAQPVATRHLRIERQASPAGARTLKASDAELGEGSSPTGLSRGGLPGLSLSPPRALLSLGW